MTNTSSVIKKVAIKGPIKALIISMSSFLTMNSYKKECLLCYFWAMDDQTKIHLSPYEAGLVNNSEWILTKNTIIKKAKWLMEEVQQNIFDHTRLQSPVFPQEVITISPKISKGENYKGLPWLMLDYPRYFDKENIFAIRIMFWWGNFFSTTLHLSGHYKQKYNDAIIHSYEDLHKNEFYICINDEQWDHHFEKENYLPVRNFGAEDFADQVLKKSFVKLSCKLSFSYWNDAVRLLSESFTKITGWLS